MTIPLAYRSDQFRCSESVNREIYTNHSLQPNTRERLPRPRILHHIRIGVQLRGTCTKLVCDSCTLSMLIYVQQVVSLFTCRHLFRSADNFAFHLQTLCSLRVVRTELHICSSRRLPHQMLGFFPAQTLPRQLYSAPLTNFACEGLLCAGLAPIRKYTTRRVTR